MDTITTQPHCAADQTTTSAAFVANLSQNIPRTFSNDDPHFYHAGIECSKINSMSSITRFLKPTVNENTKPEHGVNTELSCSTITYGSRTYLLDEADEMEIVSSGKRFMLRNLAEVYPYFKEHGVTKNYLDFLFNPLGKRTIYSFANGNKFDLRRANVSTSSSATDEEEAPVLVKRKYGDGEHVIPSYSKNQDLDCYVIACGPTSFLVDKEDYQQILSIGKPFSFDPEVDTYPYYKNTNNKRCNYLEIIFSVQPSLNVIHFKNHNPRDLRKENVTITPQYFAEVLEGLDIIEYLGGHVAKLGAAAGTLKNPKWKIREADGTESIVMYCEPGALCKLCDESNNRILEFEKTKNNGNKISWYRCANGYVQGHSSVKTLYIHQIILDCFGNGQGTASVSVDHIDRNPMNNKLNNLRRADREMQQNNSRGIAPGTLRERSSKKELPTGITPDMLRKFVYYHHEVYNKEENKTREFFRVEHPNLPKGWCSSKSAKISIQEKLAQANQVADDLDRDILPPNLAKTITITTVTPSKRGTEDVAEGVATGGVETGSGGGEGVGVTKAILQDFTGPSKQGTEKLVLPKYVVFTIARDKPHLVFDKRVADGTRLSMRMVLPSTTYVMQEQLEILNQKIIDKYGTAHKVL